MPFYSRISAALSSAGRALPALILAAASAPALLLPQVAGAQCNGFLAAHTPAVGVPSQLWGDLQPTDTGQLPASRDTTNFTEFTSWLANPYFQSVDIENGWLFVATSQRFQIWDANTNPGLPELKADVPINAMNLTWGADAHAFIPFQHADSPPGRPDLAALVGENGTGMIIFNTSNRNTPAIVYQDHGPGTTLTRKAKQVHTTVIGGRAYGFAAAEGEGGGVLIYDMDAAKALSSRCTEGQPGSTVCPGVYKGKLGTRNSASFVHGVGNYVIVSSASTIFGMEIWDVSTPTAPRRVMNALNNEVIYGVAMWQQGSKYYAAVRSQFGHRIYDVSCITQGGSCGPTELWSRTAGFPSLPGLGTVSFSRSNTTPFLYWGTASNCSKFPQEEWLEDVSNPSAPRDITPQAQVTIDGEQVTYWSWYYRNGGPSGFNHILPKSGKFYGSYFYRAAKGILDIHQRTGALPPIADFTYAPQLIYPGTDVTFSDATSGQPISWDWTFSPDGNPSFSSQENPTASFIGTGSKTVTLQVTNGAGTDSVSKTLKVLDPAPQVATVSASPSPALLCQPITFTAEGVTGEPPLTFAWQIFDADSNLVDAGSSANSFVWQANPQFVTAGETYTAEVTVSNSSGVITRTSAPVLINALPALPLDLTFSPTYTGFPANPSNGNVQYQVIAPGATEWRWNFDVLGGGGFGPWTDDPISGPAPTHNYTVANTYQVQVEVRNCVEAERSSAILNVTVDNISPLEAQFTASGIFCIAEGCFADAGQPINFADQSTGEPDTYDYDWDGNGSYENPGNANPVTSHTYTSAGDFAPKLRVNRGSQSDIYVHPKITVSTAGGGGGGGGGGTPSISISGVSGGNTNQALTFTATASNCTPNSSGWSWNTSDGTVNGASNSNRITVSWSSTGSKLLRVANTSCNPATGTRSVTISVAGGGGGGGGGTLNAVIKITPTTPQAGDTVTFNGTSSSGSPTNYTWKIDGDLVSGATATRTFNKAGNYPIELEVSRQDASCPFGVCSDKATTTLAVGGGVDQLLASFGVNVACFGNVCSIEAGQTVQFTDTSTGPVDARQWNFGDGTTSTSATPSHSWSSGGVYAVVLNVTDGKGGSAQAARTFEVTGPVLDAAFTSDRPCVGGVCTVARNQTVQFTDQSTGEITSRQWAFGDGSTSTDVNPAYKWPAAGLFTVILTVTDGGAQDSASMLFQVQGPPPVVARFDSDAACSEQGCTAETLDLVQFTDNSDGELATWAWDFGDGSTSVLQNPTHAWRAPGQYTVKLTVSDGEQEDTTTRTYDITGLPVGHNSILVPWVVQGQGALTQSSKLYLHNPDSEPQTFKVRFLRRPAAGSDIPEVELDLSPGATAYFGDVMAEAFGLDNVSGFIEVEPADIASMTPVAVGFHQTFQDDGTAFGQGVPGVPKLNLPKAGPGERMHLIGLNDNDDRFGFFGITNPNDAGVSFRLHFYNRRGERIGDTPDDFVVARLGQRQFQLNQLRNSFGIRDEVDYRVEVELLTAGLDVYTYGTNLRTGTEDPSFVRAGEPTAPKIYLLGTLATSGLNNTEWQTDALLANVDSEMSTTVVTYVSAGNAAVPLPPETLTLLPGESKRLQNVLVDRWDVSNDNGLGVLVFESTSETGVYPIVQGETYDNANPARRFGQFVAPLTDADVAEAGHRQILAGLQQDGSTRSTIWVYNPGETLAEYDLIYRALDGTELGAIEGYRVRPGRMRQINPSTHPIPEDGAEGGFTVQIVVRSGKLLSAAQVVNDANNDPSYVTGVPR